MVSEECPRTRASTSKSICSVLGAASSSTSLLAPQRADMDRSRARTAGPSRLGSEAWALRWQSPT
eukprot:2163549-Pyramimonas_sp.AAC.1